METGTKIEVVKGRSKNGNRFKPGEIWDLQPSEYTGICLRKLNKNGSSTRILNGKEYASALVSEGRAVILASDDPKAIAHDALITKHKGS